MNSADLQTTGVVALLTTLAGLIGACIRGVWEVITSARKGRREEKTEGASREKLLHDAAQEGIMAFNKVLSEDNDRLRKELDEAQAEIKVLKTDVDTLREENSELRLTTRELTRRLDRLEGRDAG